MHIKSFFLITLMIAVVASGAPKKEVKPQFNLIPALPIDVSQSKEKNKWAVAFFDTYIRFRLEPLKEIHTFPREYVYNLIPQLYTFTPTDESTYYAAAQKSNATHFMIPQFEFTKNKTVLFNVNIVDIQTRSTIVSFDREFSVDQIPQNLDTILCKMFNQINYPLSTQSIRFFQISIAGPTLRSLKMFGETVYEERNTLTPSWTKFASEYEKCITKDPTLLIAHYNGSDAMMKSGQYEKASKYLRELLDLVPIHTDLFLYLSTAYRMSNKPGDAYLITSKFDEMGLKTNPYLFEKAKVFEALKQLTNAYKVYYQILQNDPKHADALLFCARFYNNDSKFSSSIPFSDALIKLDNSNGYAFFERGRSLLGLGKIDLAVNALQNANKLQPSDPSFAEYLGDALVQQNKNSDAVDWYLKALTASGKSFPLLIKTAISMQNSGKSADALSLLARNVPQYSSEPLLKKHIGLLEYDNNNFSAAINPLTEYLKTDPNDFDVLFTLGLAYQKVGKFDDALVSLQKALPRTTRKLECNMEIARVYLSKNDAKSAQTVLKEIIVQKQIKGAYALMGDASLLNKNIKEALFNYSKERELHGNDKVVQEKIARLHFQNNAFAQSSIEYKRLLQIMPDHNSARYFIAIIMLKDGNFDGAESVLREAPAYGDPSLDILYMLGDEYFNKSNFTYASDYFNKIVSQKPDHEDALRKCALSYINAKKETQGAEYYLKLFDLNNSRYSNLLAEAGHLFYKNESNAKAIAAYMLYLNRGFTDPVVSRRYAELEYGNKNYAAVCTLLKNVNGTSPDDRSILLPLADSRCQTGDFKGALPLLNTIITNDKNNKKAIGLIALANEKTGDIKKAITYYELYTQYPRERDFDSVTFHLGELYESQQMVSNAIQRYEDSRKLFPEALHFHERLSVIYMKQSLWKQAQEVLEAAHESPEVQPEMTKKLATVYYQRDAIDKSITTWRTYLDKVSSDAGGWHELGQIYYKKGNFQDAITVLNRARQIDPESYDINALLGKTYIDAREFKKAIIPLGHARKQSPNDLAMIELTAKCYRNLNETSSLASLLKEWITLDPKRYDIKMELGSLCLNQQDIDKALIYLQDAVTFLPLEARPHILLAQAYELLGKDSLRLIHLDKASKLTQDSWELNYQYARYFISKNKNNDAEIQFKKVLTFKPEHAPSHFELGLINIDKKNYPEALSRLQTAIRSDGTNPLYHAAAGYAYALNEQYTNAQSSIDMALQMPSQNPNVYLYASRICRLSNDKTKALDYINKALKINPDYAKAYEFLGDLNLEAFNFKEASKNYFLSWEKGGYNAVRALKLGNALTNNLQFNEAKGFYESILNHNDPSPEAVYRTIFAYCKLADLKNARKFQKYFGKDDAPWIQLAQGILYETENNSEAALTAYSIASKISPDNSLVAAGFGRIYGQFGQSDLSIVNFKKALVDSVNMQNYIDLATVFQEKGMYDSALVYFHIVNTRFPEHPWVQIYIASLQSQQNDHISAIAMLQHGIKYHPNDPMIHFLLGQELEQSGKFEEAINEYQVSLKIGNGQPIEALRNIGTIYFQKLVNDKKAKEYYKKYVKAGGNKDEIADAMKKLEKI